MMIARGARIIKRIVVFVISAILEKLKRSNTTLDK